MDDAVRSEKLNLPDALALAIDRYGDRHFDEAERLFRAVAQFDPASFEAIKGLGLCRAEQNAHDEALGCFDRAFALLRNEMVALTCNRARSLGELARSEEALSMLNGLITSAPDYMPAIYNRGLIKLQLGRHHQAIADLDYVLEHEPNNDLARFGRGFANLVLGNYEEGFRDYECRLKDDIDEPEVPLWTGAEDLRGKTILVHGEMGLGDNIMFMRYVPLLVERGAKVLLAVDANVAPIAAGLEGTRIVGMDKSSWPKFDYWVRFMSLALCFGTTQQTVPSPVPLHYNAEVLNYWSRRIGGAGKFTVGLVWAGGKHSRYDSHRTISLEKLAPLFDLPGIEFVSLQKEIRDTDRAAYERLSPHDIAQDLKSFGDTMHAMATLDLVITVDTSVAHMAGTVGVPTWIMLTSYRTYWLWIEKQTHSPWYPSARLFRQKTDGDWDEVVSRLKAALQDLIIAKAA